MAKNIDIPANKINAVQKATQQQSLTLSGLWHSERRMRLTGSRFGSVVKRNPSIPVTPLVHELLYPKFKGSRLATNGLRQEKVTIPEYILKKAEVMVNVTVQTSGLVIHPEHKMLAGSPDGTVHHVNGNDGHGLI